MRDIATATVNGNLTREVELRPLPSGTEVARLRVASETCRRRGEKWVERTDYFTVEVSYGPQATCVPSASARARAAWLRASLIGGGGPTGAEPARGGRAQGSSDPVRAHRFDPVARE
jgi:hypothetical protein